MAGAGPTSDWRSGKESTSTGGNSTTTLDSFKSGSRSQQGSRTSLTSQGSKSNPSNHEYAILEPPPDHDYAILDPEYHEEFYGER